MKRTLLLVIVILMISTSTLAQSVASVRGRIADERGAGVAGAEVWLRSRAGAHLLLVTDNNGDYSFKYVVPGDYVMEVKAKGFATFTSKELRLARGQSIAECARVLHLSPKTVSNLQSLLKEKLNVSTSAALVHLALRHGLIAVDAS